MGLYLATLPLSPPKIAREMLDIGPEGMPDPPGRLCPCTSWAEQTDASFCSVHADAGFFRGGGAVIRISHAALYAVAHQHLFQQAADELVSVAREITLLQTAAWRPVAPRPRLSDIGFPLSLFRPVLLLRIVRAQHRRSQKRENLERAHINVNIMSLIKTVSEGEEFSFICHRMREVTEIPSAE